VQALRAEELERADVQRRDGYREITRDSRDAVPRSKADKHELCNLIQPFCAQLPPG
jgi:hypothetical protein